MQMIFSNTTVQKHQFFSTQLSFYSPTLTSTEETTVLTILTFVGKGMFLLFNSCLGWSYLFFQGASIF